MPAGACHQGQIALYIQKRNRYLRLRAPNRPEISVSPELAPEGGWLSAANPHPVLITKPLLLAGKALQLNEEANRGPGRSSVLRTSSCKARIPSLAQAI